jgi:hypothetical protein
MDWYEAAAKSPLHRARRRDADGRTFLRTIDGSTKGDDPFGS